MDRGEGTGERCRLMISSQWLIPLGELTTRTEVAREYGGARYGGIQPSRSTPNILIYTDPSQGEQHGYVFDGWDLDESDIYYSGEGQTGDQSITKGNKAIASHVADGRTLRVFEVASGDRPGGKLQRYVGEFEVDSRDPYRFEWVNDPSDQRGRRRIVVFRLRALSSGARGVSRADATTSQRSGPRLVAPESNLVDSYDVAPATGDVARRREAELMRHFEASLIEQGHEVARIRIPIPGTSASMVTDTFVSTTRTLWEVKYSAEQQAASVGIGTACGLPQVHRVSGVSRLRLGLPSDPGEDLRDLIYSAGHSLVLATEHGFVECVEYAN